MVYHLGDFGIVGHTLAEILRYADLEPLGLADVDDGIGFIPDDIHPGQQRQHTGFFVEFSFCHGRLFRGSAYKKLQKKRRVAPPLIF